MPMARRRIGALRRHLGIVFDIGHQAVGFEDIPTSLQKLVDAGIPIVKLQEAAAMHIPRGHRRRRSMRCSAFAKTVYLSQTVREEGRQDHAVPQPRGRLRGLEDATPAPREWRTHFHVPVFLDDLGAVPHRRASRSKQALALPQGDAAVRASSRSKPTPGTCCPTISRPATSSTTSAARSSGSRASSLSQSAVSSPVVQAFRPARQSSKFPRRRLASSRSAASSAYAPRYSGGSRPAIARPTLSIISRRSPFARSCRT